MQFHIEFLPGIFAGIGYRDREIFFGFPLFIVSVSW